MTRRLDLVRAVETRLRTITLANGYATNIGDHYAYWQDLPFEYGETGAVALRDTAEETQHDNRLHTRSIFFEVEAIAFVPVNSSALELSEQTLGDLITAIGVDPTWGGLASQTRLQGNEKDIETDGRTACRTMLMFAIQLRTKLYEP